MNQNIRCKRCAHYEEFYKAPPGKVVRNPSAPGTPMFDECWACNGTGLIPQVVLDGIKQSFPNRYDEIIAKMTWNYDHYGFNIGGLYVGCEIKDGYCHS
jgi:hypothetical protein